jgi:hypothetical protein
MEWLIFSPLAGVAAKLFRKSPTCFGPSPSPLVSSLAAWQPRPFRSRPSGPRLILAWLGSWEGGEEARGGEGTWERMDHGNKRASGREKGFPGTQAKGIILAPLPCLCLRACHCWRELVLSKIVATYYRQLTISTCSSLSLQISWDP